MIDNVLHHVPFWLAASSLCGVAFGLSLLLQLTRHHDGATHRPAHADTKSAIAQPQTQAANDRELHWTDWARDLQVSWTWSIGESPPTGGHSGATDGVVHDARHSAPPLLSRAGSDGRDQTARRLVCTANQPQANTYLQHERDVLQQLQEDDFFAMYLPPLARQEIRDGCLSTVSWLSPSVYCVEELRVRRPSGIGGRHIGWMFNRVLELLGHVHRCGLAHSNLRPHHLWFDVRSHGLQVTGWQLANHDRDARQKDLRDAAAAMLMLLREDDAPPRLKSYLLSLRDHPLPARSDAWQLRDSFGGLLRATFGKSAYVAF